MKKKNINILIKLILCIILFFSINQNYCKAEINSVNDFIDQGLNFIKEGKSEVNKNAPDLEDTIFNNFKIVGQVLVSVGIVVVIIITIIMAIKWITATPDKQAVLKQQLIGLVVSIVVIFGAVGIWSFTRKILESILEL